MKEIKMKESSRIPKVRNPAVKIPKELAKMTALEAKEKSHRIADNVRAGEVQESPTEYASAKVETAEEWAAGKAASVSSAITRGMAKKSYEKIRERSREQALSEDIKHAGEHAPAGEPAHPTVTGKSDMPGHSSMPGQPSASGTGNSGMERLKKNRAKNQIFSGQKIKMKPDRKAGLHASSSRSVKTAPRIVNTKFSDSSSKQVRAGMGTAQRWQKLHTETAAKRMAVNSAKAAQAGARQGVYYGNKAVRMTARGISAAVRAAVSTVKSLQALMAGVIGIAVLLVIMIGVIGGILCNNSSQSSEPLSPEVLNYTPIIQRYAQEYGIPEYVQVIQAIMMQESGGQGTDPMQASECPYNTQYPNSPGGITDPEYSIKVGIQNYADCVRQAGCTSPHDLDKLKLSLQGYNYGNGYIGWAIRNYGGYSEANALRFSQEQAAAHGWSGYGDPEYVPHVLRYYSGGNLFAGLFGSSQMVSVAMTQLGNEGGQKFWSWYGFSSREEWCACFVSWCADQCGLIENGTFPRFSLCSAGMSWFQTNGKWQGNTYQPSPGTIIFFDWNGDGNPDHVGIVEKCENGRVYTVEGNSGDAVKQRNYELGAVIILGFGILC